MNNIGVCMMELGDLDNARDRFLEAIDCTPEGYDYTDPYSYLGQLEAMSQ